MGQAPCASVCGLDAKNGFEVSTAAGTRRQEYATSELESHLLAGAGGDTFSGKSLQLSESRERQNRQVDLRYEAVVPPQVNNNGEIDGVKSKKTYSSSYFDREIAELEGLRKSASDSGPRRKRHDFTSGSFYEGEWLGCERHGMGKQVWPDGAEYHGQWQHSMAHGRGLFRHFDGDTYIGEWRENTAHGLGIYEHRDGTTYAGCFFEDLQQGLGVERWSDGSQYSGDFGQGKKNGFGAYEWPDGSKYIGLWEGNQIDGSGTYVGCDGRRYSGQWRSSTMHGLGYYAWPDGRSYRGQYVWDQKNGFGRFAWADRRRYEGFWVAGKQHGLGLLSHDTWTRLAEWASGERLSWYDEADGDDVAVAKVAG